MGRLGPTVKSRRGVWVSLARISLECLQVKEDVIQPYRAPHEPHRSEERREQQGAGVGLKFRIASPETGFGHSHASRRQHEIRMSVAGKEEEEGEPQLSASGDWGRDTRRGHARFHSKVKSSK